MRPAELVDLLNARSIYPYVDGGRLKTRSEQPVIAPELAGLIRAHKDQLISFLSADQEPDSPRLAVEPRSRPEEPAPVSYGQQALWFIDQLEGSTQYNIPGALRARGRLNKDALQRALDQILIRHEVLRTTFEADEAGCRQVVGEPTPVPIERVDLSSESDALRDRQVDRLLGEEADAPFDLASDLMLRVRLIHLSEDEHVISFTTHHIASDGWSSSILVREFMALYEAFDRGLSSPLGPLQIQYADYAQWQRSWLRGAVLEEQLGYWREQLSGLPEVHGLALDRPRPARQDYAGALHVQRLDGGLLAGLKGLAQRREASLFMVLEAAFAGLLGRWSDSRDVVVGVPTAGRTRKEVEPLIGFFINTLALRTDLSGDPSFEELLERTRRTALAAFAHQDVPFEMVIEALQPRRDLSYNAVCQVKFVLQNHGRQALELTDLNLSPVKREGKHLRFDLDLTVTEEGEGLTLNWSYKRSLFEAGTIERMAEAYRCLLEGALSEPGRALSGLSLLDAGGRVRVLSAGCGAVVGEGRGEYLPERILRAAARHGDRVAVRGGGRALSYGRLVELSGRLSRYLSDQDLGPGSRVGIYAERSVELLVAQLGVLGSGAAYVPLLPGSALERLQGVIRDADIELVLVQSGLLSELPMAGIDVLLLDEAAVSGEWLEDYAGGEWPVAVSGSEPAYVIYTSGSTGEPKGVVVTHAGLIDYLAYAQSHYYEADLAGSLVVTSHAFDITVPSLYLPLLAGGVVELVSVDDELEALAGSLARSEEGYLLRLTPSHARGVLRLLPEGHEVLGRHVLVVGGEPFSVALARDLEARFRNSRIYNHYGPTETVVGCTLYELGGQLEGSMVPIGKPMDNVVLYVLDGQGELVPEGMPGELYIGGPGVSPGYLHRPELNERHFVDDRFAAGSGRLYRSGDLVRWRADGDLEFIGRCDDQVKLRGYRIELGEVESVLGAQDGVSEAAVAVRGEGEDRRLVGYLVAALGEQDEGALVAAVRGGVRLRLPEYMVPGAWVVLEGLPRTANGKVERRSLPEPEAVEPAEHEEAATELERALVGIWEEILKRERLSVTANFFDLGGHSLLATRVVSAVSQRLGRRVPVRALFEQPTVRELAGYLEGVSESGVESIPVVSRAGDLPLSFAQQRLWFIDQLEGGSAQYNMATALRLEGALDEGALQAALDGIVARHEVLRTTFESRGGAGVQVIHAPGPVAIERIDLSAEGAVRRERRVRELARAEAGRAFDLSRDPLLRVTLIRLAAGEHVVLFTLHHIASDGWSRGVLVRELVALYEAAVGGGDDDGLAPLAIQYADFASWQRGRLQGELLDSELGYWRERLAGIPQVHSLPLDHPRPAQQDFTGGTLSQRLPGELLGGLKRLARRHDATLFMVLQAGFAALLGRFSHAEDVVMGTPVAGRTHRQLEPLIGFFVNTLVLRTDLSGNPSFAGLLERARQGALEAYAHQEIPFEMLVEELQPARSLSHAPLFQVMFALRNNESVELKLPGLSLRGVDGDPATLKFDLELLISETDAGLELHWLYAERLFAAATIERLAQSYALLLEGVVADPEASIHELPLVSATERRRLLSWSRGAAQEPPERCLHELIEARAAAQPEAIAVACGDQRLSYAELDRRANRVARFLTAAGVKSGDRVGVFLPQAVDRIVALLGVLKADAAYVPLAGGQAKSRLAALIRDSAPRLVLSHSTRVGRLPASHPSILALDELASQPGPRVFLPGQTHTRQPACVLYGSGATGVVLSHLNLVRLVRSSGLIAAGTDHAVAQASPIASEAATFEIWGALAAGARLQLVPRLARRDPQRLQMEIEGNGVSVLFVSAPVLAQAAARMPHAFAALDYLVVAGAVDAASVDRVLSRGRPRHLIHVWGSPLFAGAAELTEERRPSNSRPEVLVGRGQRVLDPGMGLVPVGGVGRLWLRGEEVATGYLNQPARTARRFLPDPQGGEPGARLFRSDRLVRLWPNGGMSLLPRSVRAGPRMTSRKLGELERTLNSCPGVARGVVAHHEDEAGQRRLVAYVVPVDAGEDAAGVEAKLRAHVRSQASLQPMPEAVVVLTSLPLLENGEVNRLALPPPELGQARDRGFAAPRNQTEAALCTIWAQLVRVDRVGIHDNFFELGGDSILAIQAASRANDAGISITTRQLFEAQTVSELARLARVDGGISCPQEPCRGGLPLLPIQQWFLSGDPIDRHHFNQSVLLTPPAGIDGKHLHSMVEALYQRHDALRLRFVHEGSWQARFEPLTPSMIAATCLIESLTDAQMADPDFITARCQAAQCSLAPDVGPLWRAVLLKAPGGAARLLLVVHHLVVDGVSWRILLSDLETGWRQCEAGRPIRLGPKTSSVQQRAVALHEYAAGKALAAERAYWLAQLAEPAPELPSDERSDNPAPAAARPLEITLSVDQTRRLLADCHQAYRTRINELLLSGLYLGLQAWTGNDRFMIAMEGHGREDLFSERLDLSETVGWFTCLYPLLLCCEGAEVGAVIRAVKETCRRVPHQGIGYGILRYTRQDPELETLAAAQAPPIGLNYLGQFDQTVTRRSRFQVAAESAGPSVSPRRARHQPLGLRGRVAGERLRLLLDYDPSRYRSATMARLAEFIRAGLEAVIGHCAGRSGLGFTPSDFPLANISASRLDALCERYPGLERLYPATPTQEGMYFHVSSDPAAYVNQTYRVLSGRFDPSRFRAAWQELIDRHDALRTAFVGQREGLQQVVLARAELPWVAQDLSRLDSKEQAQRLAAFRRQDKARGFDMARAPLMRVAVFRLAERRYQVLWTHHHMVVDGWCLPLIMRELFDLYQALVEGRAPEPAVNPRYEAYIRWLAERNHDQARDFWHRRLADLDHATALPLEGLPGGGGEGEAERWLRLDDGQTARLRELARSLGITLNTLVQFAWAYLLHRYSGEHEVVFGATISGRPAELPGVGDMIGLFINTVPVRVSFSSEAQIASALRDLHAEFQRCNEHGYLGLPDIAGQSGLPAGAALFDSILVFENYPVEEIPEATARDSGLRVDETGSSSRTHYKLTLIAIAREVLRFRLSYRDECFAASAIDRLLDALRSILDQLAEGAHRPLKSLDPMSGEDRRLIHELATWRPNPARRCVHELFEARARAAPSATALIIGSERVSYGELERRAGRLAGRLRARGVGSESPVGLCLERGADMVVGMLGTLKAGGAYVPLDPSYPEARLHYMIADTGTDIILSQRSLAGLLADAPARLLLLDETDDTSAGDRAAISPGGEPARMAYIIYTSGSTGQPKGVVVEHRSIVRLVNEPDYVSIGPEDVVAQASNASFDAATFEVWGALCNGAALCFIPRDTLLEPARLRAALKAQGVSVLFVTTALFNQMALNEPHGFDGLETLLFGGEAVDPAAVDRIIECGKPGRLVHVYGPTENTTFSTGYEIRASQSIYPIGRAIAGTSQIVLDGSQNSVPPGGTGELYLGGEGLARGYWNRPQLTDQRFVFNAPGDPTERLYRTGDLVRVWPDGNLEFIGRTDDQVKIRGFRIEPGEVAARLRALPEVSEAVVVVRDGGAGKRLVGYVVPAGNGSEFESADFTDSLRRSLRQELPDYMVPQALVALTGLPLNPNGKIDEQALPDPETTAEAFVAPSTATEERLAAIWQQVLGIGTVSVNANFFELGGHSLLATRVLSAVLDEFQCRLSIQDVFSYQTVCELALCIDTLIRSSAADPAADGGEDSTQIEQMEW